MSNTLKTSQGFVRRFNDIIALWLHRKWITGRSSFALSLDIVPKFVAEQTLWNKFTVRRTFLDNAVEGECSGLGAQVKPSDAKRLNECY